ncbi:MAG: DUF3048 domain-containing protein [Patescibacteria group bacterium]
MQNKKPLLIILGLGVYLLSSGLSFAGFTALAKKSGLTSPLPDGQSGSAMQNLNRKVLVDVAGSQTEACPLNGAKFTKVERTIWETRRPLAVMIENHLEARSQSGLADADVIYETIAEGGITRFMALFYCRAAAYESILGPVRSARTYFLDWASEYNEPLYAHVGGANTPGPANALGQINDYGWGSANDLNQFSIGYPTFWRDYERLGRTVATEHTMYSTTEKLWAVGLSRDYTNVDPDNKEWAKGFIPWKFSKEEADLAGRGDIQAINYTFWEDPNYAVSWQYDKTNNVYKRSNAGQPHLDLNINEQLSVKTVVVQLAVEKRANDGYEGNLHLLYGTTGKGQALIFSNGQAIKGTWAKAKRLSRTIFYDEQGKEIQFNPGRIWISVLSVDTKVDY